MKLSRKIIASFIALSIIFGTASISLAVGPGGNVPPRLGQNQNHSLKDTKIDIKSKLETNKKNAVARVVNNRVQEYRRTIAQLLARINRLNSIAMRIKFTGADITNASSSLALARTNLANATVKLNGVATSTTAALSGSNPGEKLAEFKTIFAAVKVDIKAAHKNISDAISSLKGVGTSTATTATTTTNQ